MRLRQGEQSADVRLAKGEATLDGKPLSFRARWRGGALAAIELDGVSVPVRAAREGERVFVWYGGGVYEVRRSAPQAARGGDHTGDLLAPMPGRVRRAFVAAGDSVERGQVVLILEAMKMEHAIRAPKDGVVSRIAVGEGDLVEAGVALAEIT